MMNNTWLIRNAELVNEGRLWHADVRIRNGRIETIAGVLQARPGEQEYDAAGQWLLPGMIDDQVHFREPGMTHKADIASESRACLAGGITSFMEMPNTRPPAVTYDALENKYLRAAETSRVNYAFYFGATNDNLDLIRHLDPHSTPGIKVFMGASTGNMLVDNPATLEGIFRDAPIPLITHCEDTPLIEANLIAARKRFGAAIPVEQHPIIRSREACLKSSQLAVDLARRHGTRLHILHISTTDELQLFTAGPIDGKQITAETCIHFLHFSDADYARLGNQIKCNPAIKTAADRDALIQAVAEQRIDVLATDHAPHLAAEKEQPYEQAPSGLPLAQFALQAAMELVFDKKITLQRLVEVVSHAPAKLFAVAERGFIREGYFADLVIIDPSRPYTVNTQQILSKCAWSPFEGSRFRSSITATFVNGQLGWDGEVIDDATRGQRLRYKR